MSEQAGYGASWYQVLFDAIPSALLVVDEDIKIHDSNPAAAALLGEGGAAALKTAAGEALHCLQAANQYQGCGGGPACHDCAIRTAVNDSLGGGQIVRRRAGVIQLEGADRPRLDLLVTASPLRDGNVPLTLLLLEDVSELSRLREIVPICAKCKRVRVDEAYWAGVEEYFRKSMAVEFSHGICPTCMQELYGGDGSSARPPSDHAT